MSDFIVTSDVSSGVVHAGHESKRTVRGSPDELLPLLIAALERLDYQVLNESPVHAKRRGGTKRLGKIFNATVNLTIALRVASDVTTRFTFDYEIASAAFYATDHLTVEREVDAIVAMVANGLAGEGACSACAAPLLADSAFCRSCGSPNVAALPLELEILRVDAEVRYGNRAVITGLAFAAATLVITLPMIFLATTSKILTLGWILFAIGQAISLGSLMLGARTIGLALDPRRSASRYLPQGDDRPGLHTRRRPASVTERTTRLLDERRGTDGRATLEIE